MASKAMPTETFKDLFTQMDHQMQSFKKDWNSAPDYAQTFLTIKAESPWAINRLLYFYELQDKEDHPVPAPDLSKWKDGSAVVTTQWKIPHPVWLLFEIIEQCFPQMNWNWQLVHYPWLGMCRFCWDQFLALAYDAKWEHWIEAWIVDTYPKAPINQQIQKIHRQTYSLPAGGDIDKSQRNQVYEKH